MDLSKYFAIGHASHVICNPLNEAKLDALVDLLALPENARILDMACGKAGRGINLSMLASRF